MIPNSKFKSINFESLEFSIFSISEISIESANVNKYLHPKILKCDFFPT